MRIYIPTLLRNDNQITLRSIPPKWRKLTTMVVDQQDSDSQAHSYGRDIDVVVCPKRGIGAVRQFIIDEHNVRKHGDTVLMLDDDLRFFIRRVDDRTKFFKATEADVDKCFTTLERSMAMYVHGGIIAREGGNRVRSDVVHNSRLLRALAYSVSTLRREGIRFDRLPVMEDFDVSLQLLKAGYPSVGLAAWVQDQTRSNAPGGCSTYRSLQVQADGAHGLAKLHAPFVSIIEKTTSVAWGGATRTDVKVYWQKAFKSSQADTGSK